MNRRQFVVQGGSCAAHLALAIPLMPGLGRRRWMHPSHPVVAQEKFGRLEQVAEGVWALISTPLGGDYTTTSNGGIIAGRNGVMVLEGLQTATGARWLAERARELTGRWPTHVAISHYHGDHVNGVAGYRGDTMPRVHLTAASRDLAVQRNRPEDAARAGVLADAVLLTPGATTVVDLGGREVRLVPRAGHTASDVTLELEEPGLVFGGDLVWNAMFPNFVDAAPVALAASVRALRRTTPTTYVPGHGPLADVGAFGRYVGMLDAIEEAARRAAKAGTPAAQAAAAFRLPESLGEWALFSPQFPVRAFEAWERALR